MTDIFGGIITINHLKKGNKIMSNVIKKRDVITNEIFKELTETYPLCGEKTGIAYAQDMDYFSLEALFFEDATFRLLVEENNQVMIVYLLLRKNMCFNGWYYPWSENNQKDFASKSVLWGIDKRDCLAMVQLLIDNGLIVKIHNNGTDYLTDVQQIYNWEMLQSKRKADRARKQTKKKSTTKEIKTETKTEQEMIEEHFSTYQQDMDYYCNNISDYYEPDNNPYDDTIIF